MKVAIIGCGLMGQKRARSLMNATLTWCIDQQIEKAQNLAKQFPGAQAEKNWDAALVDPNVDIVIIATLHASLAELTLKAVQQGKHVLVEKPGARQADELNTIIETAKKTGSLVRVGFNHRYHRALRKARQLVDDNEIGELMFIRAHYGHGGRIGYDKEWRAQPALSGGGELIDQGVHLIDLARWFLGDFKEVHGHAHTYFWNMPVDDNGFLLLKTANNQIANLHASCTEWKNTFSFQIYGQKGKIDINGLGGSYGVEKITLHKMRPEMGPPDTIAWEYPMADDSWEQEFQAFLADIETNRQPAASLMDAKAALTIVEQIYRMSNYDHRT